MVKSIIRWTFILAVLLAAGPLVGQLAQSVHDHQGGRDCSLLISGSPLWGIAVGAMIAAVAMVVGFIGSRFFSLGTGLACAGLIYMWAAWNLGATESLIRASGGTLRFELLGLEGAALMALAAFTAHLCTKAAAPAQPADPERRTLAGLGALLVKAAPADTKLPIVLLSIGASILAGALVGSVLAVNGLKGQALFAAIAAGIACGFAAASVANSSKVTLHPVAPMAGMLVLALLAPIAARVLHGTHLVDLMYQDRLLPLARILSVDWVAGALLGVPVGMSWAGVVLDVRAIEHPEPI